MAINTELTSLEERGDASLNCNEDSNLTALTSTSEYSQAVLNNIQPSIYQHSEVIKVATQPGAQYQVDNLTTTKTLASKDLKDR